MNILSLKNPIPFQHTDQIFAIPKKQKRPITFLFRQSGLFYSHHSWKSFSSVNTHYVKTGLSLDF
jgi:hypothetical protein